MAPKKKAKKETPAAAKKAALASLPSSAKAIESDSNLMAAVAEFFSLTVVVPILLYLIKKEDKHVKFHSLQSTILGVACHIIATPFWLFGFVIWFPILCVLFIYLLFAVIALYTAYKAYQGKTYELPFIGGFAMKYI